MAEPIEIRVSAEGVEAAAEKINSLTQDAKNMGDATHKAGAMGKLGLWGLGEAAENAAQSMGIPNQMGRRLGNTVEDLIGKTGKYAAVLGGMGLAVAGAAMVWSHFNEQKQKHREELEKSVGALSGEVSALYKNQGATQEAKRAQYDLLMVKREMLRFDLTRLIDAESEALKKQNEEVRTGAGFFSEVLFALKQFGKTEEEIEKADDERRKKMRLDRDASAANLKAHKAQLDAINRAPDALGAEKGEGPTVTNQYEREAAYQAQLVDLYRATGVSKEEIWQQELVAFDTATVAKMANATSEQQYYDTLALRDMERQTKVANHDIAEAQRTAALKKQLENQAWAFAGNLGAALVDLHNKHEKQTVEQQKRAAKNKIWINAAIGVTKELADKGWAGLATGAFILAEAAVQAAVVDSQNYDGGGSTPSIGGGGLPSTAPPAGGGGTINIYVNGEKAKTYKTGAGALLKELYESNGSVDGYSVSVELHA